ncbi:ABC transporter permease [Microbacterium keratanolyticum]|uniref:ABC transporter permease n=1 Tax=Microbacterium keratanolyticum TaxID=67574 RepID=UPI003637A0D3
MKTRDLVISAIRGVASNRTRSALTVLMVVIGVASVITLVAVGNATTKKVTDQVAALGATAVDVSPGWTETGPSEFSLADADTLRASPLGPDINAVAPTVVANTKASLGLESSELAVTGTTPEFFSIKNSKLMEGRLLSAADVGSPVVVLDDTAAQKLSPGGSIVGSKVVINGNPFTAIGVIAEPSGASRLGLSYGGAAYAPLDSVQRLISGYGSIAGIVVGASDAEHVEDVKAQITAILSARSSHDENAAPPEFVSSDDLRSVLGGANESLSQMLAGVAGISLVVAGVGVTNVMLLSVRERTREIGVRKALGARRSWIAAQFILEAAIVSVAGGAIGVAAALLIGLIPINGVLPLIDGSSVALAAGISITIGVVFGAYPAVRAASLSPLAALRSGT